MTSDPTEVVNLTELPLFTRTAVATRTRCGRAVALPDR